MPAERLMPTQESADLIDLTRTIVDKELRPHVDRVRGERRVPARRLPRPRPLSGC